MIDAKPPAFGFVPSLEILPFFADSCGGNFPFVPVAFSSYGRMARELLTSQLDAGILPWEIFIADILALPGERRNWAVDLFLHACPTELVLRNHVHRHFHQTKTGSSGKLPARLVIGVESRNSLTRHQLHDWYARHNDSKLSDVTFKMLPMDLMIRGLTAEAIDGFIAPTPWGILAQEQGTGKAVPQFKSGKYTQNMVLVRRRIAATPGPSLHGITTSLSEARSELATPACFHVACDRMAASGNPILETDLLEKATQLYPCVDPVIDSVPTIESLTQALVQLKSFAVLPSQIAANETTARLLVSSET